MIASTLHLSIQDLARLRIKDAYGIHRIVYDLFEPARDMSDPHQSSSSGILYADKGMRDGRRTILIVSDRAPRHAAHGALQTKNVPEALLGHTNYRFEVVVNPVKRVNATGKIVPLRTHEDIAAWFVGKSPAWGFAAAENQLEVVTTGVLQFEKKGQKVTLGQATIRGVLQVTDPDRFAQSFSRGIGRGKAFGCGLLQIVPAQ